ncbi:MAG: GTPase HflX [Bacteroidetes bacterium]|nr:GTPase HflX [Bacteroidota bacterium]
MTNTTFRYDASEEQESCALLITIQTPDIDEQLAKHHQSELKSLVSTLGMPIAGSIIVTLREPNPAFLIGTGKMAEIVEQAKELEAECIIIDHDLSPSQQRNWEKQTEGAVIDRREVILQIFADRASTREAVLQSALAQQEYSMPRLTRAWTHLSRQRGGTKGTRGEGETQLEVDRRIALKKISRLKAELKKVKAHRDTQRKQRRNLPVPTGSIVGYTNAGKSSLLHALTDADVLIENKLFATLDPTTRRIVLSGGAEVLVTDTVGFVQKLPHNLVEAFKSTLEETKYSDFIIHVIDAAHPDALNCYKTTMEVLESLGCVDKPMLLVFNKMDLIEDRIHLNSIMEKHEHAVFISIKNNSGLEELLGEISTILSNVYPEEIYLFPPDRYDLVALIKRNGSILKETYGDDGITIHARIPERLKNSLNNFIYSH